MMLMLKAHLLLTLWALETNLEKRSEYVHGTSVGGEAEGVAERVAELRAVRV